MLMHHHGCRLDDLNDSDGNSNARGDTTASNGPCSPSRTRTSASSTAKSKSPWLDAAKKAPSCATPPPNPGSLAAVSRSLYNDDTTAGRPSRSPAAPRSAGVSRTRRFRKKTAKALASE